MEKSTLRKADLVFSVILIIFGIFVAINGILLMIEGASQPAIHRDPAGTAPREDQPGYLRRSRDRQDYFAMILGDAMTHTFTMIPI